MTASQAQFHLERTFPDLDSELVERAAYELATGASLTPELVGRHFQAGLTREELLRGVLGIARGLSVAPVSGFAVGSAALAAPGVGAEWGALYLGANLEFAGAPLHHTVHAEQAVVNHAWLSGEAGIDELAITETPCGHCRQFLQELGTSITLMVGDRQDGAWMEPTALDFLLPHAFGPAELGKRQRLMTDIDPRADDREGPGEPASVHTGAHDPVELAIAAGEHSHAPYTGNRAAVALETADGNRWVGRYAESAAYNPSLLPLASALSRAHLQAWDRATQPITRAVLAASEPNVHIRGAHPVLEVVAPGVRMEVFSLRS